MVSDIAMVVLNRKLTLWVNRLKSLIFGRVKEIHGRSLGQIFATPFGLEAWLINLINPIIVQQAAKFGKKENACWRWLMISLCPVLIQTTAIL
jgi:hypothetical protein